MPRTSQRSYNRRANELRPVELVRGFTRFAAGSVLVRWGDTHVLCTATFEEGVPKWKKGQGTGWVTAEYDMLPSSTSTRKRRTRERLDGRTQEIQRLIGRSLRAVVDFEKLGENTIQLDCDVLQADGGTRTASVTAAYVALCDAVRWAKRENIIKESPITRSVAAVSVGVVGGRALLDLDYAEDSTADVDLNVVMTGGEFVEVQGTGENATFSRADLDRMLKLASNGIDKLTELQNKALRKRLPK